VLLTARPRSCGVGTLTGQRRPIMRGLRRPNVPGTAAGPYPIAAGLGRIAVSVIIRCVTACVGALALFMPARGVPGLLLGCPRRLSACSSWRWAAPAHPDLARLSQPRVGFRTAGRRAQDLREQAQRMMAPGDAEAAATEEDIRAYLREQPERSTCCAGHRSAAMCPSGNLPPGSSPPQHSPLHREQPQADPAQPAVMPPGGMARRRGLWPLSHVWGGGLLDHPHR
jgi:hypothetical protein